MSTPGVATVIPSCSTVEQLAENAGASGLRLTDEHMQRIAEARQ